MNSGLRITGDNEMAPNREENNQADVTSRIKDLESNFLSQLSNFKGKLSNLRGEESTSKNEDRIEQLIVNFGKFEMLVMRTLEEIKNQIFTESVLTADLLRKYENNEVKSDKWETCSTNESNNPEVFDGSKGIPHHMNKSKTDLLPSNQLEKNKNTITHDETNLENPRYQKENSDSVVKNHSSNSHENEIRSEGDQMKILPTQNSESISENYKFNLPDGQNATPETNIQNNVWAGPYLNFLVNQNSEHFVENHESNLQDYNITNLAETLPRENFLADIERGNAVFTICPDYSFPEVENEYTQMSVAEGRKLTFNCDKCPRTFPTQQALNGHQNAHRTITFSCDKCPRTFPTQQALNGHQNAHRIVTFNCDKCPCTFPTQQALNGHQNAHRTITFNCDKCPRAFPTQQALNGHQNAHRTLTFNRTVPTQQALSGHQNAHRTLTFDCAKCPRSFPTQQALNGHQNAHRTKRQ